MAQLHRRRFTQLLGAATAATLVGAPHVARAAKPRVVVIGGGAGGGTAAKYLAMDSKGALDVLLIEPSRAYYSCFFSNHYLGGFRSYESLGHTYGTMASKYGVGVIQDWATNIDRERKRVRLGSGADLAYDRLVVSPGIDLIYDSVKGYSEAAAAHVPHAWEAGTQLQLLKAKVLGMKQGGTFVIVPPPDPYRCPPGPYERVSVIANLFKQSNPNAKIIILDPKEKFSKQGLFQQGWERYYPGMIQWLPPMITGGVTEVDIANLAFKTDFDTFKADAASIIPAQKAGRIARNAGLADETGWCPIRPDTMQSTRDESVHVIGDSAIAAAMPKSAFAANSQAKVAAMAIRAALLGTSMFEARFTNACWSLIAPDDAVKVGGTYKAGSKRIEPIHTFISSNAETAAQRKQTYEESIGWYEGISNDIFG